MTTRAAEEFADPDLGAFRWRANLRRAGYLAKDRVKAWIKADWRNIGLWAPVAIASGAGFYFWLKTEPYWLWGVFGCIFGALIWSGANRLKPIALALFLSALGFVAADWRTARIAAPVLDRELGIRDVSGRVLSIEDRIDAQRILIELDHIEGIERDKLPARARVTWRGEPFVAAPGSSISMLAGLRPPPGPAAPGTFDFGRQLFFQKIGAIGFVVREPQLVEPPKGETGAKSLSAAIETWRSSLMRRILDKAPNEGGAIIAAIVTGKREAINDRSRAALRDAGLAHLLAISGLHMGIATGLIFLSVRFLLSVIPPIAKRYPIKKWAAIAAIMSGIFYLALSGGGWSARRAFITAAIMFAAILVDRRALSLRNVAIAASLILLTTPEALFHPGFQMSFAAVTALVAGFEWMQQRPNAVLDFSIANRLRRYAIGLAATDLIAALATAPFALFHFNRVAIYSLPANVIAMPIMAFWIAPSAIAALVLAPFGLDGWAWQLSALGMEAILATGSEVSSWPGAISFAAQWPLSALLCLSLGGLWLCLARSPLRLVGLAGIPLASMAVMSADVPNVFVADSGQNAGVRIAGDNGITVYSRRRDRFSASVWNEAAGVDDLTRSNMAMSDRFDCDKSGCVTPITKSVTATFISDPKKLAEDCSRADLVVAFFPVSSADWLACEAVLIDRRSVWRRGAHSISVAKDGSIKIETVAATRGRRPWTGYH